ncbi:MAG: methyltransferase family protein [Gammaproteobacteria bacterium]
MDNADRLHYIGLIPIFTGAAVCLKCFKDFITKGKGTPAPIDPPKILVVDGLYRKVRNPMYIGILLILLGEAFLFSSPILYLYSLMMYCIYHLLVIGYEEPALLSSFGEAYEKYCASVPRWLIRIK